MAELSRIELPARTSLERQNLKMYGCKGKGPLLFTCVAPRVLGIITHYIIERNRTIPCSATDDCEFCRQGYERRPRGYMAAVERQLRYCFVAEIPEACWRAIERNPLASPSLRSRVLKLYRKGANKNAPVYVDFEGVLSPDRTPAEFDPSPMIAKAFGKRLKLLTREEVDLFMGYGLVEGEQLPERSPSPVPAPARQDAPPAPDGIDLRKLKEMIHQAAESFAVPQM